MDLVRALEKRGCEIVSDAPDVIICGSISQLARLKVAVDKWPKAKLFVYNWDLYEWSRRDGCYDYRAWGKMMARSKEVWHPSECTLRRAKDWHGLVNGRVIKTFVPVSHLDKAVPKDEGYVLMALRDSPDVGLPWCTRACDELGIPAVVTKLGQSREQFINTLAGASVLVNPLREASTGGLFLIEGLYLGKPALVSSSPWNAGKDYLGSFASVPKVDNYDHFRDALQKLWEKRKPHDVMAAQTFIQKEYSLDAMADKVAARL